MKAPYIVMFSFFALAILTAKPTPTPPPRFSSNAEIVKLPKQQILDTLDHQDKLIKATQDENVQLKQKLVDTTDSQNTALKATSSALSDIVELRKHDTKMTNLANEYGKKLNWYRLHFFLGWIIFGTGVIACIVLVFLKLTGRLSLVAASVASKVP